MGLVRITPRTLFNVSLRGIIKTEALNLSNCNRTQDEKELFKCNTLYIAARIVSKVQGISDDKASIGQLVL